jgi:hypothetical protein
MITLLLNALSLLLSGNSKSVLTSQYKWSNTIVHVRVLMNLDSLQIGMLQRRDGKYIKMQTTATDLWTRLETQSPVIKRLRAKAAHDSVTNFEPFTAQQLINAVLEATATHVPSMAGHRLVDVSIIASKAWSEHFKNKPSIKNDPAAVFEHLSKWTHTLRVQGDNLRRQVDRNEAQEKSLREELQSMQFKYRVLEQQVQQAADKARRTAGVPRAQHAEKACSM